MQSVNVAKLKASLSAYLKKVKAGEQVIITQRGTPVARIVPVSISIPSHIQGDERARLTRLAAEGKIRLPQQWPTKESWDDFWKLPMPEDPDGSVLKALLEDREDRF